MKVTLFEKMSILVVNTEIKMEEKKRRNFREVLKKWSEEEYKNDFEAGRFFNEPITKSSESAQKFRLALCAMRVGNIIEGLPPYMGWKKDTRIAPGMGYLGHIYDIFRRSNPLEINDNKEIIIRNPQFPSHPINTYIKQEEAVSFFEKNKEFVLELHKAIKYNYDESGLNLTKNQNRILLRFNESNEYKNEHEHNWENDIPNLEW